MLIAQIESPSPYVQGDQVYRTFQPCQALAQHPGVHVVAGTWLSPLMQELAGVADILVLCQATWADFLPVIQARRARKLTTIYEVNDNFLDLQPWNPSRAFYADEVNTALVFQLVHASDALLLSCDALQTRFGMLNANHKVFLNQRWNIAPAPKPRKGPLRIGWAGSGGHREDIAWAIPALRRVLLQNPEVHCAFMAEQRMHELFDALPKERTHLVRPGSLDDYHAFLQTLDIGIAPLIDTPFNRCRSDVKYLEYAACGVAVVAQNLDPYSQVVRPHHNGLLFDDQESLQEHLNHLIQSPSKRLELANAALADVNKCRQETDHSARRLAFYRSACRGPISDGTRARACIDRAFKAMPTPAFRPHERFWQLRFDHAENNLLAAMLAQDPKEFKERLALLEEAVKVAPKAYLPALQCGLVHTDPTVGQALLQKALALNPMSNQAAFSLGANHFRTKNLSSAAAAFATSVAIAPGYAQGHEALARIAQEQNDEPRMQKHLEDAVAANPYYRRTAAALAQIRLRAGDYAGARACLQHPSMPVGAAPSADYYMLWAEACQRLGDLPGATQALQTALCLDPGLAALRAQLARVYLLAGDRKKAMQQLALARVAPRPAVAEPLDAEV